MPSNTITVCAVFVVFPGFTVVLCVLCRFGKRDLIGRYPVHFHNLGDGGRNSWVDNVAVHHSPQRCIVVHCTDNVMVSNNFCFDVAGFGVMLVSAVRIAAGGSSQPVRSQGPIS